MRAKLSLRYSLLVLAIFVAFVFGVFGLPDAVTDRLSEGSALTVAVALAFLLMILPVIIAWIFLRQMDREVEPLRAKLAERRQS